MELKYAGKFVNNGKDYERDTIDVYDNIDPDRFSTTELRDIMKKSEIQNCREFYYTFAGKGVHEGVLGLNSDAEILYMLSIICINPYIVVYVDHEVDVRDIIKENYSQSQQTEYEQFFNDIPDECFSQVDENFVKTQCKNDASDGGKAAKGKGPMYDSDYVEVVDDVDDDEEDDVDRYEEDDVVEASGEASLLSVPIYDDSGDESEKEIYDEENDAALEDDNMFMHNVQIPKVPVC